MSEASLSKGRYPLPLYAPAPSHGQPQKELQSTGARAQSAQHIIPRLIKLSLLCALCWLVRGAYLLALRVWRDTDRTPFDIPERAWEALFYCLTEFPPSLGALVLMISKPRTNKATGVCTLTLTLT